MMAKKRQGQKVNWWILILVILLALLFLFSRSRRAPRSGGQAPALKTQLVSETHDPQKPPDAMTTPPASSIPATHLLGQVDPQTDQRFVIIDPPYANRSGMYLQQQVYAAFLEMHAAASEQGLQLTIISAMRSFNHQKRIWEGKWNGSTLLQGSILATDIKNPVERSLEILKFSAMPGTSRHHWGTDIDLNSLQNSYFVSGDGKKIYEWLQANARQFGFYQPYTARGDGRTGGYEEEKWHWSYFPLSSQYMESYPKVISYEDIKGFDGWETAREIDVIKNYVLEVSEY